MHGGFGVTKAARHATRWAGRLAPDQGKAITNRRNRHHFRQQLHSWGEDADYIPKLYTEHDVA